MRAVGQALVLTPISTIATAGIAPSEATAASGSGKRGGSVWNEEHFSPRDWPTKSWCIGRKIGVKSFFKALNYRSLVQDRMNASRRALGRDRV